MLWFCDRTLNYPAVGQRCDSASDSSLPTSRPVHTDFSNNLLEDAGVRHLCEALCEQTRPSGGLAILVLWNNRLKSGSALHFNKALEESTEECIRLVEEIRNYCQRNEAGDQTDGGEDDSALRATLCSIAARKISLTCDTSTMRPCNVPPVVTMKQSTTLDVPKKNSRLRSPAPSPIPSPVASPSPTRTRFQVSKVSEESSENEFFGVRPMRFRVTPVDSVDGSPPPKLPQVIVPSGNSPQSTYTAAQSAYASQNYANQSPAPQRKSPVEPTVTPPRTRKLSSWMSPIFPESKVVTSAGLEKLLGLFQNPFGIRGGGGPQNEEPTGNGGARLGSNNAALSTPIISVGPMSADDGRTADNDDAMNLGAGATWPQAASLLRSPASTPIQSATSAPSMSAMAVVKPTGTYENATTARIRRQTAPFLIPQTVWTERLLHQQGDALQLRPVALGNMKASRAITMFQTEVDRILSRQRVGHFKPPGATHSTSFSAVKSVAKLNVGGVLYTTTSETLGPLQARLEDPSTLKDSKGRVFLDRDGVLFRQWESPRENRAERIRGIPLFDLSIIIDFLCAPEQDYRKKKIEKRPTVLNKAREIPPPAGVQPREAEHAHAPLCHPSRYPPNLRHPLREFQRYSRPPFLVERFGAAFTFLRGRDEPADRIKMCKYCE
ncbi:unnamed protein product [Nesidiocoris tenuis]|uniref:Potassium channel tetramerisation-type BTB domain-containing protein n=1 Tax=Nesidiocoris tenuis TaxID=355587 RepID=A0A6H5HKR1_9HEMI|nr:unnamed protein product [Nesidiocoris tenuis]